MMLDAPLHAYWARCAELGAVVDPRRADHARRHWAIAVVGLLTWALADPAR